MSGTGNKNTDKHGAGEDNWKDDEAQRANKKKSDENYQSCQDFWQLDPNADGMSWDANQKIIYFPQWLLKATLSPK